MSQLLDKKWARWLLLLTGAVLTALAVSYPAQIGFLEWVTLIPSALVILRLATDETVKLRKMWGIGLLFFWCYYAIVFHWFLALYPMDFTDLSKPAAAFVVCAGMFGLSLLQALFSAFSFVILALAARSKPVKRMPFLAPFLSASVWVLAEWFQTVGWWGVPWGRLSIGQTALLPLVQSVSLFGSYFVSFLVLSVNFLIAYAIVHYKEKAAIRLSAVVAAGLFVFNLAAGLILLAVPKTEEKTVRVAAIQGNISSLDKWSSGSLQKILEIYREYSLAAAKDGAELIVWSETAIPQDLSESESLKTYIRGVARDTNAILMVGAFDRTEDGQDENAVYTIYPDGTISDEVYVKRHLVPFGEYVPLRKFVTAVFPPLADVGMLSDDLAAGTDSGVVNVRGIGKVGSIICFDSIYETLTLDSVRDGAELMILPTNDSWFQDSTALRMHNAQAVLRSVETGRYLVRAANTGISSVISPTGEIREQLGALRGGYIVSDVATRDTVTLYTRIGNLFVYLVMIFVFGMIAYRGVDAFLTARQKKRSPISDSPDFVEQSEKNEQKPGNQTGNDEKTPGE